MKIVVDNKIPFIKGALEKGATVVYLPGNKIEAADVVDADALIVRTRTKCNEKLLKNSSVKFIATATIGYDHIDTEFCKNNGIEWTNAPGCNSSSVEQYIVSALLYLANMQGYDLRSKTIGVIGVGNVGKKVARAAAALGCKVMLNDPPRAREEANSEFVELKHLLSESDFVTIHVPLTADGLDKTLDIANESFFDLMKDGATLINSSRGEVVNENDLMDAIQNEKLADAVLDVYNNEPKVSSELLGMLSIGTPHIAGYSADGKAKGTEMSVHAVSKHFKLGLDTWKPKNVPGPKDREILVDGTDAEELDLISEVYARTYNVQEDHDRFMDNMSAFEKLRGDYRIRREPSAFSVRVFNDDGKYKEIFEGLGFSVIGDSCY
jgi:erythronate-4-phosphate dehydrogenase